MASFTYHPLRSDSSITANTTLTQEIFSYFPIDIVETAEQLLIIAELPGIAKETLEVWVADGLWTIGGVGEFIRGQRLKGKRLPKTEKFLKHYLRQFKLPFECSYELIKTNFQRGLLEIVIPKQPVAPQVL